MSVAKQKRWRVTATVKGSVVELTNIHAKSKNGAKRAVIRLLPDIDVDSIIIYKLKDTDL